MWYHTHPRGRPTKFKKGLKRGRNNTTTDFTPIVWLPYIARVHYSLGLYHLGLYSLGPYSPGPYSPGLYSFGPYSPGLCSPGPYSLGAYSLGLYSPGPYSLGPYSLGLYHSYNYPATGSTTAIGSPSVEWLSQPDPLYKDAQNVFSSIVNIRQSRKYKLSRLSPCLTVRLEQS